MIRFLIALVIASLAVPCFGQVNSQMQLPEGVRNWYRNPDGSCVQCSLGMCGAWTQTPQATTLLWDTEYGDKVRGGSWPQRVSQYSQARQIPIWNVTGSTTWDWMRWAAKTGRYAAIGAGSAHFQTLYGWDDNNTPNNLNDDSWFVCNNNSPTKIDRYTWSQFQRLHLSSGQWVVVLDTPAQPAVPQYVKWW